MIDSRELLEEIVREILKERAKTYQNEKELEVDIKEIEKKNEIDDGKQEIVIELESSLPESREQLW